MPADSSSDNWVPKIDDYVQIFGTSDEWEDVIGVLEELNPATDDEKETWTIFVPTSKSALASHHMVGVNHLTDFVRYELRANSGRVRISPENIERVDPEDF